VSAALDYPSGSAFRNACKRYLGLTPLEIRAAGGASTVLGAMLGQMVEQPVTKSRR
jgi:AraC-like DNA-binding protein